MDAAQHHGRGAHRPVHAVGDVLLHGAVAVVRVPSAVLALLRGPDGGLEDAIREMARADRAYFLRLPQPEPRLWRRRDRRLPAADFVLRTDRARPELGPRS